MAGQELPPCSLERPLAIGFLERYLELDQPPPVNRAFRYHVSDPVNRGVTLVIS